ncbi:Predicted arabinose efflux permease, MFS family [Microlunatus sagamiharensis]|uniref:Predicted arabinose efflux permease, MFS family n=1 Tax=Microlunatus sagamiharensis TaxID=546874 RepID=A0A1H2LH12_9ACTN|nr:MFS transporter [Microlunatus sagamiharensis]SDU80199.1 Predicted arabinose efflux permease, MFS family [Microlunatus sagamiharensis]
MSAPVKADPETPLPETPLPETPVREAHDPAEAARANRMFAALAEPNYRIYFAGAFVSNIGTWMQRVAQDWLVLELSHGSALAVGVTTGLQFLPMLLLSPYGGLVADRFDKRRILRVTQGWLAVCAAVLGVLAVTGVAQTWHVFVVALAFGLGTAFDNPARQAFVSEVAGKAHIANAIGLNSANFNVGRIIGPAIAGLVIAAFGSGWAILSNAVTYGAMILALTLMNARLLNRAERPPRAKHQIREGMSYVWHRTDLLLILCVAFFVGTFGMNFQMTSALMAQQEFHKGAAEYGILGTFMAVGSLTGALLAAKRRVRPRGRFVVVMALAFAAVEIVAGLMPTYATYAAILPLLGLVALSTLTAANASVQLGAAPHLRGRVMALYMMVLMGGTPIGAPLLGWVGEVLGPRWTLIGGGGLTALGVIATVAFVMHREHLRITPHLQPRPNLEVHAL